MFLPTVEGKAQARNLRYASFPSTRLCGNPYADEAFAVGRYYLRVVEPGFRGREARIEGEAMTPANA